MQAGAINYCTTWFEYIYTVYEPGLLQMNVK